MGPSDARGYNEFRKSDRSTWCVPLRLFVRGGGRSSRPDRAADRARYPAAEGARARGAERRIRRSSAKG